MSILWTGADIASAVDGKLSAEFSASDVVIDSRRVSDGSLFIAIRGETNDGHDYLASAFAAGAAGAITEEPVPYPHVLVDDAFEALWLLAAAARRRSDALRIAVTGSVGKTGTKELLAAAFSALGATHKTEGNYNNHFGAPLTLANMPPETAFGIFELGMSAPGEIFDLTDLVKPDIAMITAIAAAHSEFFKSEAEIAKAKAEIFSGLTGPKIAVYPADGEHTAILRDAAELAGGALRPFADDNCRVLETAIDGALQRVSAGICEERFGYSLAMPGDHWARNSLMILQALIAAVPEHVTAGLEALSAVEPLPGRGNILTTAGGVTIIDETYNASPAAVRAALQLLASRPAGKGRRVAVLGDMLELGDEAPAIHAALAPDLAGADLVILAGPLMKALSDEMSRALYFADADAAAAEISSLVRPGDTVLIKGSLGSRMARVRDALT